MASQLIDVMVGMAETKVTRRDLDVLVAQGLGSCIAVCMRDPIARVTGLTHVALPQSVPNASGDDPRVASRYADTAIPHLVAEMEAEGASTDRLMVAIVGGAEMMPGDGPVVDVAKRNTVAVLAALRAKGLRLAAHDIGGTDGRICQLFAHDGRLMVRSIGSEARELAILGVKGSRR